MELLRGAGRVGFGLEKCRDQLCLGIVAMKAAASNLYQSDHE
ncbi:MAG: hypothetical protein V2I39_03885 [Erythrobacter sp.]|jgi:hypothetical protein|nr:hypothetical protein [Erythrobacter sp.]